MRTRGRLLGKVTSAAVFALEHLANEDEIAGFVAVADAVTDHAFAEIGGEFGSEIADLVGVGERGRDRAWRNR